MRKRYRLLTLFSRLPSLLPSCLLLIGLLLPNRSPAQLLKKGYVLFSCAPNTLNLPGVAPDQTTLAVLDVRRLGEEYAAGRFNQDVSGNVPHIKMWQSNTDFGGDWLFGVAVDSRSATMYAANSTLLNRGQTDEDRSVRNLDFAPFPSVPKVYKLDPATGAIIGTCVLNGASKLGVGYITLDEVHNQLFATDLDNGLIYRIRTSDMTVLDTYDPGATGEASDGNVPAFGEGILGVAYNPVENRLYYSVINNLTDGIQRQYPSASITQQRNTIRSVGLTASGNVDASTDQLDMTLSYAFQAISQDGATTLSAPVGHMVFDQTGTRMLIAELPISLAGPHPGNQPTHKEYYSAVHFGRVLSAQKNGGTWTVSYGAEDNYGNPRGRYFLGGVAGQNSRGGVAWGYGGYAADNLLDDEAYYLASGDLLRIDFDANVFIYGLQFGRIDSPNGRTADQNVLIDMDGVTGDRAFNAKYLAGIPVVYRGPSCLLPTQANILATPATCPAGSAVARNDAAVTVTSITNADRAFLFSDSQSLPPYAAANSQPIASGSVSFTGLANPAVSSGSSYSVVLYNGPDCFTVVSTTVPQTVCRPCSVSVSALAGQCAPATNTFSSTVVATVLNPGGGILTVSDGARSQTFVTTTTGENNFTAVFSDLPADASGHTVSVSLPGCGSATATYSAPVSCSVAPACGLSLAVTPGLCLSATNSYVLSGSVTATNVPTGGTLTISSAALAVPRSLVLPAGDASGSFSYSGLVSNGERYTITASFSDPACSPVSQSFTAPLSCSVAPVCSLSATAAVGACAPATNTYSASVVVALTNAPAGTITVSLPGSAPINQVLAANTGSFTAVFADLPSDGTSRQATISLPGCGSVAASFTAPVSCSVAPVCSLSVNAVAGVCSPSTNTYSVTALVTISNPTAGTVSVSLAGATQTFSTTANAQNTFRAVFQGLSSDGAGRAVTASLPGCGSATAPYTAPASCSVTPVCSISAVATAGPCDPVTNNFSSTAVVTVANPTGGQLVLISDGTNSQPFTTTAGASNTFTVVFSDLPSSGLTRVVTVSLPGCGSATAPYTAPASCSVAPVCSISAVASVGPCNPVTNAYSTTALVTIQNPPAGGTLTVSAGSRTLTFSTTALSQNTFAAVFNGLVSDGLPHAVVASLPGCSTATATYTAPVSCSTAPVCSLSAVARPGACATTSNTFSNTVLVTMTNPVAGTLTVTDGPFSVTTSVPSTVGQVSFSALFNGLPSTGSTRTVTISLPGCSATTTTTYTAPAACSVAPTCSIVAVTATPSACAPATNQYSVSGSVSLTNAAAGTLVISAGGSSTTVTVGPNAGSVRYTIAGLSSNGATVLVTASLSGCGSATTTYAAPASCSPTLPTYAISKSVDRREVELGGLVTYSISLTNTSPVTATNVIVTDAFSSSAVTVTGSITASAGTFTVSPTGGNWLIPSLGAGQAATLVFQARVNEEGLVYNVVTAPNGSSASACLTVPFHVCEGLAFEVELEAPASFSTYQWLKNDVPIAGATGATYSVTAVGRYSVAAVNTSGCPDGSCCPFVVVADSPPSLTAVGVASGCNGASSLNNASITLVGSSTNAVSYNVAPGSYFAPDRQLFTSNRTLASVSAGVLLGNLANPAAAAGSSYTVRVYSAQGCYQDIVVVVPFSQCQCPAVKCTPFVVRKVVRPRS